MTILSIETSTTTCSVAICIDEKCVCEHILRDGNNHASVLPQFIQEILLEAKAQQIQLNAIAVSEGPGSYTGLRIGMSTAKGLCYGLNIPLISVPTLDILCQSAIMEHPQISGTLVPMLDARRMEVYTSICQYTHKKLCTILPAMAQIVEDYSWLPDEDTIYFFGDGAKKCQNILSAERFHYLDNIIPRASVMGTLVAQQHYPQISNTEIAYHTPFYLKEFIAAPSHIKGLQ